MFEDLPYEKRGLHFESEEPLTDLWQTLQLLVFTTNGYRARLNKHLFDTIFVIVESFHGGYGRCEHDSTMRYLVAPEVTTELENKRFVEGIAHWGYTDHKELRITEKGQRAFFEHQAQLQDQKHNTDARHKLQKLKALELSAKIHQSRTRISERRSRKAPAQ